MKHNKRLFVGFLSASIAFNSCIPAMAADMTNHSAAQVIEMNRDMGYLSNSVNEMAEQRYDSDIFENAEERTFSSNEKVGYARSGMLYYDDISDSISLTGKKITLEVGEVKKLDISGKGSRISWVSSNPNAAYVDVNGVLIASSKGRSRITAWYNGKKYSFSVKVIQKKEAGSFSKAEITIPINRSRSFPSIKGIPKKAIKISSNNPEVVSIDDSRKKIKGITEGSADLFYEYDYQDKKGNHSGKGRIRCFVVNPSAEENNVSIRIGETQKLKLSGNYNSKTIWKSSNKKVAFVDELGVITGLSEGNVTITCKCAGKKIKYKVSVAGEAGAHDHSKESDDYLIWQQNSFTTLHFYKCGNFNIQQVEPYNNLLDNSEKQDSQNKESNSDNSVSDDTAQDDKSNHDGSPSENNTPDSDEDSKDVTPSENGYDKETSDSNQDSNPSENSADDKKDDPSKDSISENTPDINHSDDPGIDKPDVGPDGNRHDGSEKESSDMPPKEDNGENKNKPESSEESEEKEVIDLNRIYENDYFKYRYVESVEHEYCIEIIELTEKGKKESVIVIPKEIGGYPVKFLKKDFLSGNTAENVIVDAEIDKSDLPEELSGIGKGNVFSVLHSYSVIHEKENIDGTYEVVETEQFEAESGKSVIPEVKEYFGFESPKYIALKVTADDKASVTYKYSRKKFTVSVNAGRGIAAVSGSGIYKYEQEARVSAETKAGYNFDGWTGDASNWLNDKLESYFKMPASNITLTAKATPINYKITYDLRGGSFKEKAVESYNTESENFVLKNPEKKGYTFAGWIGSDTEDPKTEVSIERGSIGDKDYIATWAARNDTPYSVYHEKEKIGGGYETAEIENLKGTTDKSVTPKIKNYVGFSKPLEQAIIISPEGTSQITYRYQRLSYDLNVKYSKGFNVSNRNEKHKFEEDINISTALKNGYKFLSLKDGSGKVISNRFKMPAGNMNIIAEAAPQVYTIQYNLNGGTNNPKNPGNYTIETNSFNLQAPTRTGYTFAGWTGSNGNTKEYNVGFVKDRSFGNKNYIANWTVNSYTVTFNTDGGNSIAPSRAIYGNKIGSLPTPSKTNYTFVGWYNKNGAKVDSNMLMPAENITLTARWQLQTRKIAVDAAGGVLQNGKTSEVYSGRYGEKVNLGTPRKDGYTFAGWQVNGAGSVNGTTFTYGHGDCKITAKWQAINRTIVINANGGKFGNNPEIRKNGKIGDRINIEVPSRDGYRFTGWQFTGAGSIAGNTVTIGNGDCKLIAKWEIITRNVIINANGGKFGNNPEIRKNGKIGDRINIEVPSRDGYRFTGWQFTGAGSIAGNTVTIGNGDCKLIAKWEIVTRNVIINADGGLFGNSAEMKKTGKPGDKINLTAPIRNGYRFMGWNLTGAGTLNGNTFTFGNGDSRINCKWEKIYEITINVEEIGYPKRTIVKKGITGEQIKIDKPTLQSKKSVFKKWLHAGNGKFENDILTIGTQNDVFNADIATTFYVDIDADGGLVNYVGKNSATNKYRYYVYYSSDGKWDYFHLDDPWKNGYKFIRWKIEGNANVTKSHKEIIVKDIRSDMTLKAMWVKI